MDDFLLNILQKHGIIEEWSYNHKTDTLNILPKVTCDSIKVKFTIPEEPQWREIESTEVKTFQLGEEPEIIFVIPNRKDEYIVVHADAYDSHTGKTEFPISAQGIKEKYGIDLHEQSNKELIEDFEAYYVNQKPLGLKNSLAHLFSKEVPYIKDAPVFFMSRPTSLLFYDDKSKKVLVPEYIEFYKGIVKQGKALYIKTNPVVAKTWKTKIKVDNLLLMNGNKLFTRIKKELEIEYDKIIPDAFFIHGIDISEDGYVLLQYAKRKVFE